MDLKAAVRVPVPGRPGKTAASRSAPIDAAVRVLVVENSRVARTLLGDTLRTGGFEVEEIGEASKFHSVLSRFQPHLIFLASWLPDGSSLSLLDSMRTGSQPDGTPVIVSVAGDALEESIAAIDAGATDCIHAPYNRVEILARVYGALNRRPIVELENVPDAHNDDQNDALQEIRVAAPLPDHALAIQTAAQDLFRTRVSLELLPLMQRIIDFSAEVRDRPRSRETNLALRILREFLTASQRLLRRDQNALKGVVGETSASGNDVGLPDYNAPLRVFRPDDESGVERPDLPATISKRRSSAA